MRQPSLWSRAFRFVREARGGPLAKARREEATGRLPEAAAHYLEAGERGEAARVFAQRAETAVEPLERFQLLGQALSLADEKQRKELLTRRGELAMDLIRAGTLRLSSSELSRLARELEAVGATRAAAEAFGLSGSVEDQARMLVEAGAVERLEQVLSAEQERLRAERGRESLHRRVLDLRACGRRREAVALARSVEAAHDERLEVLAHEIETLRQRGPRASLLIDGQSVEVAFGEPLVIGRSDADVVVPSPGVSRRHLEIGRTADGIVEVCDLGSSNGTFLRGVRLDVPVRVEAELSLTLGGDVPVTIRLRDDGGVWVEAAGRSVIAPLGPLRLAGWELTLAQDGWLELSSGAPAYIDGLRLDPCVQLCRGDTISDSASGSPRLRVGS
jgi:hypothetical protein